MVNVELTCRLFKDVEENSKEFTVVVHITDYIDDLKVKIYEKVKKTNNDFLEIEADDLRLWKVEIDNNRNTRLQLAFKDKIVHEGDEVKYRTNNITEAITTLRVAEGWAYINYEKFFHFTVTSFLKKKLDISGILLECDQL
ncbi:18550_t:CDS:2 [Funneliformis geosporum]|uniref:3007_t:CDS:1 n=1 Tax=Funneliformis geosporum TaxID=1117311 RepID=A0A9W4WXK9_9GLOM|nr:18550_t:CDS:2 [Funneliformis geosporum]CAI2186674.1 3007_t:CDS:2 [Funneliformis geosporum]